ncbi:MAG: acyltransferase family protein [Microcoleaceae cyanobacterium]
MNSFFVLGYQGVHIFFVLSGFSLTYSRLLKPEEKWFTFIQKKFFRIYPTYWVLLLFSLLVPWLRQELFFGYFDWSSLWRSFLLLDKAIPYSWFMFPLVQFYLLFFILFKIFQKLSIKSFLIYSFIIKFLYTLIILILSYNFTPFLLGNNAYPGYIAISRLFEFSLGMVMAKVYLNNPNQLISYLSKPSTIILAIICEIIGILGTFKFTNEIMFLGINLPLGVSLYDAFIGFGIFVIIFNLSRLIIYLSSYIEELFIFMSKISYELYLTQFISLFAVSELFTIIIPGESSLTMSLRGILLFLLVMEISVASALLLQKSTKMIVKSIQFNSKQTL